MNHWKRRTSAVVAAAALSAVALSHPGIASASAIGHRDGLGQVRAATRAFRSLGAADQAGYDTKVVDVNGISCIDQPPLGAMGVHFLNMGLVDGAVDAEHPEALVYEPDQHGGLNLVALEYLVFQSDWDATHTSPPSLLGHEFMLTPDGNRFGIPAFYSLHVWAWKHNPAGTFEMWNPSVHCPAADGQPTGDEHHGHHTSRR